MRRNTNRGLSDSSHLPSIDDDLETLLNKAEAIFNKNKTTRQTQVTRVAPQQPSPAPTAQKPSPVTAPRVGLMQRQRKTQ